LRRESGKAIADAAGAIRLEPDDGHSYGARAFAYAKIEKLDEAIADFDEAIRRRASFYDYTGRGVLQQLCNGEDPAAFRDRLAALWTVLVPQPEREKLAAGELKRLVIVPDGPLALLPFETLVVERGENPRYLLDLDVSVSYGPSITLLYNLAERNASSANLAAEPVLTVGNPIYGQSADLARESRSSWSGPTEERSRLRQSARSSLPSFASVLLTGCFAGLEQKATKRTKVVMPSSPGGPLFSFVGVPLLTLARRPVDGNCFGAA
jgi:tetratricopeptide (TPR) repeat protein